jgi:NTP pyrophosphatase (non-canonical NTP hydrolase)
VALFSGCLARNSFVMLGGMTMDELIEMIRDFDAARDWNQFHSPKNLEMALSVEVAELVEIFQWMSEEESTQLSRDKQTRLMEEIGDVMIYLVNLSDKFGINPITAAKKKLKLNEVKYPSHITRGSARKYSEY